MYDTAELVFAVEMLTFYQYLIDTLIEELHNHLYLKSPYCQNGSTAYKSHYERIAKAQETTDLGGKSRPCKATVILG